MRGNLLKALPFSLVYSSDYLFLFSNVTLLWNVSLPRVQLLPYLVTQPYGMWQGPKKCWLNERTAFLTLCSFKLEV